MDSNFFWCIMGIVGSTIFSLIISLLFFFISKIRKRLAYEIKTTCIISNKIQQVKDLEVRYKSNEIENLYCSTITIKNIGNSIVKKQDLVPSCPIHILTSGQFLDAEPYYKVEVCQKKKISKYSLSKQEINGVCKKIFFNFDYIPQKAIITYSLFHTGDIMFEGDLMDGKIISVDNHKNDPQKKEVYLLDASSTIISSIISGLGAIIAALLGFLAT